MAVIKDGVLMNTPKEQAKADKWISHLQKSEFKDIDTGATFRFPCIETMSDYKWHTLCLNSRREHPELYKNNENVRKVIRELKKTLKNSNLNKT